jgi:hypothetical protein
MNTDAVYWHKNQVSLHFEIPVPATATKGDIKQSVQSHLNDLNEHVLKGVNATLSFIQKNTAPQAPPPKARFQDAATEAQGMDEPDDLVGVYPFPLPPEPVPPEPVPTDGPPPVSGDRSEVIGFFQIHPGPGSMTGTMQENGGTGGMSNDDTPDQTLAIVNHLLQHSHPAMPHWFKAGTDDGTMPTHGCPVSPPIPVEDSGDIGQWKISLPKLADPSLQGKTGDGVTVFILDTLRTRDEILQAAARVGSKNLLLQDMAEQIKLENIKIDYREVPDPAQTAVTGKDIYGRLAGFPMADHGLFIAGIVHDLAPKAKIECIRVLNDYGVGDLNTLADALYGIYNRMSKGGNLFEKPVVINLSLVMGPPESDLPRFGWDNDSNKPPLKGVHKLFQNLVQAGAILTASAGNDSDPRDIMNALEERFGPRYPAAFAYDDPPLMRMIPVGAVNRKGNAAMYSNHPGPNGIATYGGELPKPDPWLPSAMSHTVTGVDTTEPLDALRGVYSASMRPALSKNDHHATLPASPSAYPMYHASNTWVCWSGTSFATPIISALAARILQGQDPKSVDVQQSVVDAATGETVWTRVDSEDIPGPVIMAEQGWYPLDPPNHEQ